MNRWLAAFVAIGGAGWLISGDRACAAVGSDENSGSPVRLLLQRPTCRIQAGTPGMNGEGWAAAAILPQIQATRSELVALPATQVRALADEEGLYLRFDCEARDPRTLIEGAEGGDRVWVEIHPNNDPVERWRLETDFRGDRKSAQVQRITGENSLQVVPDIWEKSSPVTFAVNQVPIYHGAKPGGWFAEFVVPWKALGLAKRPPAVGFGYGRSFGSTAPRPAVQEAAWPETDPVQPWIRFLEPGQAILGARGVAPIGLETRTPGFGRNRGHLRFAPAGVKESLRLLVQTEGFDGGVTGASEVAVAPGTTSVEFHFQLAHSMDSHVDVFTPQRVAIQLVAADGAALFSARVPFGRHLGVCVDEPYGESIAAGSTAGSNREQWLERVIRELPRLERWTTRQGAPSDFCLVFPDGRVAANLMAEDAWRKLADIVESRAAGTENRLIAAMALAGQKSVSNLILGPLFQAASGEHDYHTGHHEMMGPLSIVRYGGGPAVSCAAVLARLLQHVTDPATGRPFVTRVVSLTLKGGPVQTDRRYTRSMNLAPFVQVPGPVGAVAVDYGGSQTLLDPAALAFFRRASVSRPWNRSGAMPRCGGMGLAVWPTSTV